MDNKEYHDTRLKLQERIVNALDDNVPVTTNIAALAFVLVQAVQLKGTMSKEKFVNAMAATWDVVELHNIINEKNTTQ